MCSVHLWFSFRWELFDMLLAGALRSRLRNCFESFVSYS